MQAKAVNCITHFKLCEKNRQLTDESGLGDTLQTGATVMGISLTVSVLALTTAKSYDLAFLRADAIRLHLLRNIG